MNRRSIWDQRIPPVFSIILLVIGLLIAGWFVTTGIIFTGRAISGNTPQSITVTNITDRSFTVTYLTENSVLGTVSYGEGQEAIVAVDDRDQKSGQPQPHRVHSISVRNLKPNTSYSFSITSGGKQINDNGKPFSTKTGPHLENNDTEPHMVTGKVVTQEDKAPSEGIIMITPDGGQTLTTLLKNDGTYSLSLQARTNSLEQYLTLTPTQKLKLQVLTDLGTASVTVLSSRTNPVGPITVNNTYDFSILNTKNDVSIASASGEIEGFPILGESENTTNTQVQILSPKEDQKLSDQKPVFKGTAPPNSDVEITINSTDEIQTNVITDRRGNWSYRPKFPLSPGLNTVTIKSRDQSGILKVLTQSFTVYATGSLFTEPSVSPTKPSPTPTKKPTPTPTKKSTPSVTPTPVKKTVSKTPTPTIPEPTVRLTSTPTVVPTRPIATPTTPVIARNISPTQIITSISPQPSMAPTGSNDVLVYGILGAIVLIVGAALLFMTGIPL